MERDSLEQEGPPRARACAFFVPNGLLDTRSISCLCPSRETLALFNHSRSPERGTPLKRTPASHLCGSSEQCYWEMVLHSIDHPCCLASLIDQRALHYERVRHDCSWQAREHGGMRRLARKGWPWKRMVKVKALIALQGKDRRVKGITPNKFVTVKLLNRNAVGTA